MTEGEKWMLGCTIVMALCTLAAVVISIVAMNKKQEVQLQQPVSITITEELHKVFAAREAFEKHQEENSERHGQLFRRIDDVERQSRRELMEAVSGINADRQRTMDKLNNEFTFIREHIAGINRELKIRHES